MGLAIAAGIEKYRNGETEFPLLCTMVGLFARH
jgi:hypothetical protein